MAIPTLEIEITADPKEAEAGFGRIGKALKGVDAATEQYQQEVNDLNRAQQRGLVTSKNAAKALRDIEARYEAAARDAAAYAGASIKASRNTQALSKSFGGLSTVTRGGAGGIQNVAFQVGDFATQVGAGTSASVALGQQLPQLLGGFGAVGAVAGALAAIGIPALSFAFSALGDETDEAGEGLDNFIDAMGNVQSLAQRAGAPIADLAAQFGEFADEIQRASRIAAQAALSQAMRGYQDAANEVRSTLSNLTGEMEKQDRVVAVNMMLLRGLGERTVRNASQYDELSENIDNARSSLEEIAGQIGLSVGEAVALRGALDQLGAAEGPRELAQAASAALDEIDGIFTSSENIPPEVAEIVSALERVLSSAASVTTAFDDIAASANDAADASMRIQVGPSVAGGRGGDPRDFGDLRGQQDPYGFRKQLEGDDNKPTSGGGRSTPDRISALAKSLMSESELLESWRQESLAKLADFNALELEALGGHNEAKLRLEEEYQRRKSEIEQAANANSVKSILSGGAEILQAMGQNNQKALKVSQVFAAAEALISTYKGAAKELEKGTFGFASAAAVISKGIAFVNAIQSVNASTGAVGGGAAGGTAAAAPAQAPLEVRLSGISADTIISGADLGGLLDRLNEEAGDRGTRLTIAT